MQLDSKFAPDKGQGVLMRKKMRRFDEQLEIFTSQGGKMLTCSTFLILFSIEQCFG